MWWESNGNLSLPTEFSNVLVETIIAILWLSRTFLGNYITNTKTKTKCRLNLARQPEIQPWSFKLHRKDAHLVAKDLSNSSKTPSQARPRRSGKKILEVAVVATKEKRGI